MAGLLARILFYPTLAYNVVMEKISSRRWFDRVDQTVILGAFPFKSMTKELVQVENVRGVITMNEEYETKFFCNSAELHSLGRLSLFSGRRAESAMFAHADFFWLKEWKSDGVEQIRLSTVDLTGVPSLEHIHRGVDFVLKHRDQGTSVYIHCKAGRSRSATLAAAYLIRIHCWSPDKACNMLAAVRPHILIRSAQRDMLDKYYQQVCGPDSCCV
ncbi:phosphatidylglycerophosphatase and protein-tyrosine phosphatase 1 isoform X1 [Neoarius graeffei]|uniref:phosphatidylglycerophosphatase and protein-tyrosine phosphatase 1 isoform X1 n=1 Tax=Neoarius graeffei TaxID=443677 RepID=UPI00298D592C|nr:phosphatidylglycerophosphatase and protein-tyrosine phosphatase 1 isoform X1 [Neoarius graeffei]